MPQDAFHIRRLTKELHAFLVGGKINRISQVNKDELTFIIYTGKTTVKLVISASASGARVCLAQTEKEPAPVAPNFCMLLRKHLQGAEILDVRQHGFERIIEISLHCTTDFSQSIRVLRCELMGKYSNVLLTENDVILGALKTGALEDNTRRVLLAGAKYVYPDPQDKISPFDGAGMRSRYENFLKNRKNTEAEDVANFLFNNVSGLALSTTRHIAERVKTQDKPLWEFVGAFCLDEPNSPCVTYDKKGIPVDFFAFPVPNGVEMPSLCRAEDEYFFRRESKKGFDDQKRKLENSVRALKKKQAKKLQTTLERLQESEKADEYRIKGELLTANLYRIEKGATCVELENWYSPDGGTVKIALDETLSPSKNAQRYFKAYNKQKRTKEVLTPMLEQERAEIEYTDSVLSAIFTAETKEDIQELSMELIEMGLLRAPKLRAGVKRKDEPVPFREFTHGGMKIYAGRNNLQNDRLLRSASPEDLWLHTQKYHSSHVIIATDGKRVSDETLEVAAQICAYYSDGRDGDKIPVDYCKRKYVKKPNKSKAGFVVYTDYKTVLVTPKLP